MSTATAPLSLMLRALGPREPLGSGGIGAVESLPEHEDGTFVVKRFHRPEGVDGSALVQLVRWRRELPSADRRRLDRCAAWPLAIVRDDEGLVGYTMRRVGPEFCATALLPSGASRTVAREAQYLIARGRTLRRLGVQEAPFAVRLQVLWSLMDVLALLHRRRVVVGDLSTRNVLWSSDAGRVLLVDCDSMVLGGVGSPLPPTHTVDWDDPANRGPAASSDVYKLALLVLRVLAQDFQTRDPAAADERLDPTGRWLLRVSLSEDPAERPSADAWERWAAIRRAGSK